MTNSNSSDRLNRVEANLQTVTDILVAVARRAEATDARLDRVVESQDRMQGQLDQMQGQLDQTQGQLNQMQGQLDELRRDVDIAFDTVMALSNNTDATLASINAALERQDRVLDYLVRRDREPPQEQP